MAESFKEKTVAAVVSETGENFDLEGIRDDGGVLDDIVTVDFGSCTHDLNRLDLRLALDVIERVEE